MVKRPEITAPPVSEEMKNKRAFSVRIRLFMRKKRMMIKSNGTKLVRAS